MLILSRRTTFEPSPYSFRIGPSVHPNQLLAINCICFSNGVLILRRPVLVNVSSAPTNGPRLTQFRTHQFSNTLFWCVAIPRNRLIRANPSFVTSPYSRFQVLRVRIALMVLTLTPNCLPNFSGFTRGTAWPAARILNTWLASSFFFSRFTIAPSKFILRLRPAVRVSGNRSFLRRGFPSQILRSGGVR